MFLVNGSTIEGPLMIDSDWEFAKGVKGYEWSRGPGMIGEAEPEISFFSFSLTMWFSKCKDQFMIKEMIISDIIHHHGSQVWHQDNHLLPRRKALSGK